MSSIQHRDRRDRSYMLSRPSALCSGAVSEHNISTITPARGQKGQGGIKVKLKSHKVDRKAVEKQFRQEGLRLDNIRKPEKELILGLAKWGIEVVDFSTDDLGDPHVTFTFEDAVKVLRIMVAWNDTSVGRSNLNMAWRIRGWDNTLQLYPAWLYVDEDDRKSQKESMEKFGEWLQTRPADFEWPD